MVRDEAIKFAEHAVNLTDIPEVKEFYRMCAAALRPITHEQVEKMKGEWVPFRTIGGANGVMCGQCKYREYEHVKYTRFNFCPACGCPMTDEAVDILWKRLEAMQDAQKSEV